MKALNTVRMGTIEIDENFADFIILFNTYLDVLDGTRVHFIAVAFIWAMLTCEFDICTLCLKLSYGKCVSKRDQRNAV